MATGLGFAVDNRSSIDLKVTAVFWSCFHQTCQLYQWRRKRYGR